MTIIHKFKNITHDHFYDVSLCYYLFLPLFYVYFNFRIPAFSINTYI